MECLICKADAKEMASLREARHVNCPECGTYMISGSLDKMLAIRPINKQAARERLQELRRAEQPPLLATHHDLLQ